ncbi:hypothetical protein JKP88DRAFT_287838 [Tribonema minus]|uniref:Kinesin motor domain-containing protein n=1 Tax=Tribonema minus TaxID=303371 RepID=A0A835Z8A3_9STRA|nr:hypothetical protein JKP88DRAFT_287838 [Tribonema minus]
MTTPVPPNPLRRYRRLWHNWCRLLHNWCKLLRDWRGLRHNWCCLLHNWCKLLRDWRGGEEPVTADCGGLAAFADKDLPGLLAPDLPGALAPVWLGRATGAGRAEEDDDWSSELSAFDAIEMMGESIDSDHHAAAFARGGVSCYEIYKEHVCCLIGGGAASVGSGAAPRMRWRPSEGDFVEGCSACPSIGAKALNAVSSRSLCIFTIVFTHSIPPAAAAKAFSVLISFVALSCSGTVERQTNFKVNLIDLASSGRAQTAGTKGMAFSEESNINKSLTTIGRVIAAPPKETALGSGSSGGSVDWVSCGLWSKMAEIPALLEN